MHNRTTTMHNPWTVILSMYQPKTYQVNITNLQVKPAQLVVMQIHPV